MTVVPFVPRADLSPLWQGEEMSQLLSIYAAHEAHGVASGWDIGETELNEPQFYVVGPGPDHDCLVAITRMGREYVLEDGQGRIISEDLSLSAIADKAIRMTFAERHGIRNSLAVRLTVSWIAVREFFEERVEAVMAESVETATAVFPQLATLV
jgi:hypothetical protein